MQHHTSVSLSTNVDQLLELSVPSWLTTLGLVLLKHQVRNSKFDPLVDEVELIEANPKYAHVGYPDGREDTVATKFLAPQVDRKTEIHDEKTSLSSLSLSTKTMSKRAIL